MGAKSPDLTGQRFGRLVVQGKDPVRKNHTLLWVCRCDCGAERSVATSAMTSGRTMSCGCMKREIVTKHGSARSGIPIDPLYRVWWGVNARCRNPRHRSFHNYGGRGITICDRWREYANFRDDMLPGYRRGLSIDRIDNDGPYSPGNCRWATTKEQGGNKRTCRIYEYDGERLCITDIAKRGGVSLRTLRSRLSKGASIEDAARPRSH